MARGLSLHKGGRHLTSITTSDRIILHLFDYRKAREAYFLPPEVTQKGIAKSVGARRAAVTAELKRLRKKGLVGEKSNKVDGYKTKVKCYFLSQEGASLAQAMREEVLNREVVLRDLEGKEVRVKGDVALRKMRKEFRLPAPQAMEHIVATDFIDLTLFEPLPPEKPFPLPEKFFGREKEIEELSKLLKPSTPEERTPFVISLMGFTGVGKTSLAAKIASEFKGTFFHRTHEWDSPHTIMKALASFLKEQGKERMFRYAKNFQPDPREIAVILRKDMPRGLLIFDDCHKSEHVQSFLGALMDLGDWPAKVIAVSRRKPSFYNRADITVKGLVAEYILNGLDREAARQLLESAQGPLEDEALERAYSMTKGHPMQLLLVTAEALTKAKEDYVTYVHEAIAPELTPEEEEVLARCSVFRESFPPEALGPVSQKTIEDLTERGILMDQGNYAMHEMVKEFILKGVRKDKRRLRRYHSEAADLYLRTEEDFPRLYHLVHAGRRPEALQLAKEMAEDFISAGLSYELLDIVQELAEEEDATLTMIEAKVNDAMGRREQALELYERAGRLGGPVDKMEASIRIGMIAADLEDFSSSEEFFKKALRYSQRSGNALGEAHAYHGLGMLNIEKENYGEAAKLLRMSASRYSENNGAELSETLKLLGIAHMQKGELFAARKSFERSLKLNQLNEWEQAEILNHLGTVLMRMKRMEEAEERLRESVELAMREGRVRTACLAMTNRADVLLELGDGDEASELCRTSLDIASGLEDPVLTSAVYSTMAKVFESRRKPDKAMSYVEKSIVLLRDMNDRQALAERLFQLSEMKLSAGERSEAMKLKEEGFRVLNGKTLR